MENVKKFVIEAVIRERSVCFMGKPRNRRRKGSGKKKRKRTKGKPKVSD